MILLTACFAGMMLMLLLSGCGVSINSAGSADASATPAAISLGRIQGSNFGGHAPIVNAKVYVMQIGTPAIGATPAHQTGYGSSVYSLLTSSYTDPAYPTAQDATGDATNGDYYVATDGQGNFDISGDYTCTPGYPVYLYAQGGNPRTNPAVLITQAVVSGSGPYTISFTTAGQLLYQGESVKFTGTGSAGTFAAYISAQTATVVGSNSPLSPTSTSFQVQVSSLTANGTTLTTGTTYSGATLGTVSASEVGTPSNPAISNMAMLGLCPSTGAANFSYLSFVYVNEVSAVAMAYAMAPFAVDSLHIGTSTTNLIGLQNAALNAGTLYSIQGSGPVSTTTDGDDHIANAVNPSNSNGTVPQQTINTLANIVANCVDSANTVVGTTPAALQAESPGCSGLFLTATSNGVPVSNTVGGSTVPIDTATALINVAHYPAGTNSYPGYPATTYVDSTNPSTLFNLPTGNVPFTPQLSTAPKDWTVALTYKNITTPSAIAIDASGNAFIGTSSTTAGYINELSPQGAALATSFTPVPNLSGLAISPTVAGSYTVWAISNSNNNIYKFSSSLTTNNTYSSTYTKQPSALAIDKSGNVYVANNYGNYPYQYLSEFNSTGSLIYEPFNSAFTTANGLALAANNDVWVCDTNNSFSLFQNPSSGSSLPLASNGFTNTSAIAIDYQGEAWVTGKQTGNQALVRSTTSGLVTSYAINAYDTTAIGGLNNPVAVAVDGSNVNNSNTFNVWAANAGNNTVSEINSSSQYTSLSPSVGYQSGTGLINNPSAIVVDNAGNVWVTNQGNSTVTEIIGSATPVTTPFSAMAPGVAP